MSEALKVLDWMTAHPGYAWLPVVAAIVVVFLLYETVKALLPKGLEALVGAVFKRRDAATRRLKAEAAMRKFCLVSRNRNWAGALPTVSRYSIDVPLSDIFVLPRLALSGSADEAQEIGQILADHRILCVTGQPGSGKSTLLNSMALAYAKEDAAVDFRILESRIPICFDFQEFTAPDDGASLPTVLSILFGRHGLEVEADHLRDLLEKGRCAIFLDGLDEAGDAQNRREVLRWTIDGLSTLSTHNRLVVACRDFEWEAAATPGIARAVIQPFSVMHAKVFVAKFRDALSHRSKSPMAPLLEQKFDVLMDGLEDDYLFIASNPMLLTLAVTLLTLDIAIPKRRSEVIATFVRTMLLDWDSLKRRRDPPSPDDGVLPKLEKIGYFSLAKQEEPGTVRLRDRAILHTIAGDPDQATAWLDRVAARSGIIVKIADVQWVFSNRRILEFLAARELSRTPSAWNDHWAQDSWKEVFSFLPEIAADRALYLDWLRLRGSPATDLHALLLLRAAITLTEPKSEERAKLVEPVQTYLMSGVAQVITADPVLLQTYTVLEWETLRPGLDLELDNLDQDGAKPHLLQIVLRSGDARASRHIAARVPMLSTAANAWLLSVLPTMAIAARAPIVKALIHSPLPEDWIEEPLVRCGGDALAILVETVSRDVTETLRARVIRLISRFPDPRATALLIKLLHRMDLSPFERRQIEYNINLVAQASHDDMTRVLIASTPTFYQRKGKRWFDFVLANVLLLFFLPLLIVGTVIIMLDSSGPALFTPTRFGMNGRPYRHFKFRTMRADSDTSADRLTFSSRYDARVTRVGRLLRATSFDEIPAIVNVLRGDIAFVGPRALPYYVQDQGGPIGQAVLSRFRPGIIGLSQVRFRRSGSESTGLREIEDLQYLARCTLLFDLRLMARFLGDTFASKGAY